MAYNKKSSVMIPEKDYIELSNNYAERVFDDKGAEMFPSSFEFLGRIIFISNLNINKLDPDGAIRTRGYLIEISPTDAEMIDYMVKIAPVIRLESGRTLKQDAIDEVIAEIRQSKSKNDISLRKLVRGMNIRDEIGNDPMWREILRLYA
jgi:tRNA G37 N-methylase Trm5